MARNREYQEKNSPILSVMYVVAVIVLLIALVLMYLNYFQRRGEYERLVQEASRSDLNLDIESRLDAEFEEDDDEVTDEAALQPAEASAQPSEAASLPETPLVMDEPLNQESGESDTDHEPFLPQLNVQG